MKKYCLFIGFSLFCLFFSESSIANINLCMKKDKMTDTWLEVSPSLCAPNGSWTVLALEDIWNFNYDQIESHFSRVKDSYFTEQGWKEFEFYLEKFDVLQTLTQHEYSVSNVRLSKHATVHEQDIKEDEASAYISFPMYLKYSPVNEKTAIKRGDSLIMKIKISGPRDHEKKIRPDSPGENKEPWQFNYKIESYKMEPY